MAYTPGGGAVISFTVEGAQAAQREILTIGDAFDRIASTATAGMAALAAGFVALKIGDFVKDATLLAARYETLGIVMHTAGENAGYTSGQMDAFAKSLENSGISMLKSREVLTSMATAQLDLSKSQELGRLAQNLSVVANKNASETYRDLVTNLQQADTEGLRYMGLIINQDQALQKYAATHGTVVKALTQMQKSEAISSAALEKGATYAGIYEKALGTAGKALNSLDRYFENIKVKAGTPLLEGFAQGVFGVTDGVKELNKRLDAMERDGDMEKISKSIGTGIGKIIGTIKDAVNVIGDIGTAIVGAGNKAWEFFDKYLGGMTTVKVATTGFALLLSGFLVEQATIGFAAVSASAWACAGKVGAAFLAMSTAATNTFRLMQLSAATLGWGPAIVIAGRTAVAALGTTIAAIPGAVGAAAVAAGLSLGYLLVKAFGDSISKGFSFVLPKFVDDAVDKAMAYAAKKFGGLPEISEAITRDNAGDTAGDAKAAANDAEKKRKEQLLRDMNMFIIAAESQVALVSSTNVKMKALNDLRDQQFKQSLDQRIITQADYLEKKEKMDVAEAQGQLNQIAAQKSVLASYMAAYKAGAPLGQGRDPAADANEMTKLLGDEAAAQTKLNAVRQTYAYQIAGAMLESYTKEFGSISSIVDAQEALVRSTRYAYQEAGKTAEQREILAAARESDAAQQLSDDIAARKLNGTATKEYVANTEATISALNQMSAARLKATASNVGASFINDAKSMRDETTTLYEEMRNTFIGTDEERVRSAAQTSIRLAAIRKADASDAIEKTGDSAAQKLAKQFALMDDFDTYVKSVNANADAKIAQTSVGFRTLGDVMNAAFDPTRVEQFGSAMQSAFGGAGGAIGGLVDAMNNYGVQQNALAAARATATKNYVGDQKKLAAATEAINLEQTRSTLGYYSNIAGAAKGFFNENSKGYKVLQGVQMAFHAVETALAIEAAVQKITSIGAVTTAEAAGAGARVGIQAGATAASVGLASTEASAWGVTAVVRAIASMPFPLNLAAGAATLAAVVAVGAKMVGGLGGGSVSSAEQRQAEQGTGTVLGSSSAKSESIAKAVALTAANSSTQIDYLSGLLTTLRTIQSDISAFAAQLVRSTDVANPDINLKGGNALASTLSRIPVVGGLLGKLSNAIFGGKQTLDDSGITLDKTSLSAIMSGSSLNGKQYADITTSGGWFSSDKHSTNSSDLGADANQQFASIIKSLAGSVKEASALLGVTGDDFTNKLSSFVVDIGKISLKGMSGDEIQKTLESVFSKVGDQIAQAALPSLQQFQQVGEGYLETLVRVASDYAKVDASLQSVGLTFGMVGVESIGARESLIALMGGIDTFQSKTADFGQNFLTKAQQLAPVQAYVTQQLASLNLGWIKTREDFASEIASLSGHLDDAGVQATYAALMNLEGAFASVTEAIKDTTKSAQDLADERSDLQDQLDSLLMSPAELAAKARAKIDDSNKALYDQVQAAQAAKDAIATQSSLLEIQAQIYDQLGDKAGAAAVLEQQHTAALAALDPTLRSATQNLWDLQAAAKATEAIKTNASTLSGDVDSALAALQKVVERERTVAQAVVTRLGDLSQALHSSLDGYKSVEQAQTARAAAQAEIRADLAITKAGGSLSDTQIASLKKALSSATQDASNQFGSYTDYLRDMYETQNDIAALADTTDTSLKTAQDQLSSLDSILANAQEQVDELKGQSTTMLSVKDAVAAIKTAILAAKDNPLLSATSAIGDAYQTYLGRTPDATGLQFWQNAALTGTSTSTIVDGIKGSTEASLRTLYQNVLGRNPDAEGLAFWMKAYGPTMDASETADWLSAAQKDPGFKGLPSFDVGTNSIPYDMVAQVHAGERIIPAADNRALFAALASPQGETGAVVAELQALKAELKAELAEIRRSSGRTADATTQHANQFDSVSANGNALLVEVVEK